MHHETRLDPFSPSGIGAEPDDDDPVVEAGGVIPFNPFINNGRLAKLNFGLKRGDVRSPSEYLRLLLVLMGDSGGSRPNAEEGKSGEEAEESGRGAALLPCTSRSKNSIQSAENVCKRRTHR